MLRSNINTEKSDFNHIKEPGHVEKVWQTIEANIPIYFNKMMEEYNAFSELKSNSTFSVKKSAPDTRHQLSQLFEDGLHKYQKLDTRYKSFFSDESMQEFEDEDNPRQFKTKLSIEVPLIRKALQSRYDAMKEWQQKFNWAKAADVYAIFFNLLTFMDEFTEHTGEVEFSAYNELADWEDLIALNEDDDYNVPGVIGMGIKSSVLYFLNPRFFLCANKNTLYGFYFLCNCEHFRLPSGTNEFIMINDMKEASNRRNNRNMLIDQNYWYPYDLFILYGLRTFRLLEKLCAAHKYKLSEEFRFVHVNTFMSHIWNMKLETINTMTGGDQDDAA